MVIHELSHLYQATSDHGNTTLTLNTEGIPEYWKRDMSKKRTDPHAWARTDLTVGERLTHAETLAKFALMWYVE